jgi:transcriptional regulator with XRE-family HTH domain
MAIDVERDYRKPDAGFPARLRRLRIIHGFNQEQAAKYMGASQHTWQIWEAGTGAPTPRKVAVLLRVYDVDLDWLYYGEGEGPK